MVSGNAAARTPPPSGNLVLDPKQGSIQPAQVVCPRSSDNPPLYPPGANGSKAGMGDSNNKGAGVGFPFQECDGYASPLRADLHFPSCYDPSKGLTDYKNNMAFPTDAGNGKQDCPKGWIHVPHIFYEMYWNTPLFKDRWTPGGNSQPFVLSNGDAAGWSLHGDLPAAWDSKVLQQIIDNCDAGDSGMDKCPGLIGGLNPDDNKCHLANPSPEKIDGTLSALPGNNPIFSYGASPAGGSGSGSGSGSGTGSGYRSSGSKPTSPKPTSTKGSSGGNGGGAYPNQPTTPPKPVSSKAPTSVYPVVTTSVDKSGKKHISTVWRTRTVTATATVYATHKPTTTPGSSTSKTVGGYKYAGCYRDTASRVISDERQANIGAVSNAKCVAHCKSQGYALSGTEYGGQCFCGNTIHGAQKIAESECSMKCEGDASDKCGGGWALSVYSKDGKVTRSSDSDLHEHMRRHRIHRTFLRR